MFSYFPILRPSVWTNQAKVIHSPPRHHRQRFPAGSFPKLCYSQRSLFIASTPPNFRPPRPVSGPGPASKRMLCPSVSTLASGGAGLAFCHPSWQGGKVTLAPLASTRPAGLGNAGSVGGAVTSGDCTGQAPGPPWPVPRFWSLILSARLAPETRRLLVRYLDPRQQSKSPGIVTMHVHGARKGTLSSLRAWQLCPMRERKLTQIPHRFRAGFIPAHLPHSQPAPAHSRTTFSADSCP